MSNDPHDASTPRPPMTEAQRQWYARQQQAAAAQPQPFSRRGAEPAPTGSVSIRQAPMPTRRPTRINRQTDAAVPAAARPAAPAQSRPAAAQPAVRPQGQPAARPAATLQRPAPVQPAAAQARPTAPAQPRPAAPTQARPAAPVRPQAAQPAAPTWPQAAAAPSRDPAQAAPAQRSVAAQFAAALQQPPPAQAAPMQPAAPRYPAAARPAAPMRPAAPVPAPSTPPAQRPAPAAPVPAPEEVPAAAPAKAAAPERPAKGGHTSKAKWTFPRPRGRLAAVLRVLQAVGYAVFVPVKLAALAVIPLFVFWYGYTIDRNGWFQGAQYEREVAQALLDGHSITNYTKMEEREIVKLYAQNLDTAPTSIALGSSRVLQITRELADDEGFFNAGMIGAEYPDVYDSYYLFDRVGLIPDTVILGIDPWLFSAGADANTFKRVDMQMWNEYQRFALGRTDIDVTQAVENMNLWMALTSPAFFHESLDYYIDNKENGLRPEIFDGDVMTEPGEVKMPDGSVWYGTDFRNMTQEEVDATATEQFVNSLINCEEFYELDPEHVEMFKQFIDYVRSRGSYIIFFLTPYHPEAYKWIVNFPVRYSGFFQVENWVRQYAAEQGIPVYGSYDPECCGCTTADFFDAWHVKDTGIRKFFPGVKAVYAAREAGALPDPLAVSPRLPTATEDPIL